MAEIHVQKKRRPVWPWIAGVIALVAVIGVALVLFNGEQRITGAAPTAERAADEEAGALPETVVTYLEHVQMLEEQDVIHTFEHDYVTGGLRLLAPALEDAAQQIQRAPPAGVEQDPARSPLPGEGTPLAGEFQQGLNDLRQRALSIPGDPLTLDYTVHVYGAFEQATYLLAQLRAQRTDDRGDAAERHIEEARDAIEALSAAHLLNPQRDEVLRWMRASADALRELALP
jgi:hypothetical protein